MGEKRNTYRLLVGKPEGKRPIRRRVDIIKNGSLRDRMEWYELD
jgi:hypothetical protein